MTAALDRPSIGAVFTQWTLQPLAVVAVVALAAWYVRGVRRSTRAGRAWPVGRSVTFGVGLALLLWASCGFLGTYAYSLFWVWTSQQLALWLVVPIVVLSGAPLQLARDLGGRGGRVDRLLRSRPVRFVSNPLVGPALVPLLSFALFFGPLPGWSIGTPVVGWLLQLVLVAIGAIMVLPLVGVDDDVSSLAVGLGLAIGSFELVIDALPGIVLRLRTQLATTFFDHRAALDWSPNALHDQQIAGAIVWCIAELIDLPFLLLVFRRWLRVDAKDAARVDAVLEAERSARGAETDEPWWLSDPSMQQRLKRRD
ncbi:Cytochrome c oxidase assembly factor CtaG [Jatrophihabitans endophyticus]|uniref:Cytochrome c oxidase assembly factor CtaG n=1 Tax=Jatrophihabitans endophyticus TaxID=1206085 RepID=A0A1M5PNM8_9ACTN|nr:cytochrome c oxidase assembly protein [Jatrophihabitans endophyticus]SHH03209.1 Cytochrome c oxidase assembly factor CtaG [Jatrophihabitans endophyticus]